jgi:hypothetical protein
MGYQELKAPEQFTSNTNGQKLQGVLVSIAPHMVNGKKVLRYTVKKDNGDRVTFLETWDLKQKIDRRAIGHPISIEYVGLYDNIEKNGNKAKRFKVMVDFDTKVEQGDITDEDIPF